MNIFISIYMYIYIRASGPQSRLPRLSTIACRYQVVILALAKALHTYIQTYIHTCMHAQIHICTHALMHADRTCVSL